LVYTSLPNIARINELELFPIELICKMIVQFVTLYKEVII
jgi:hypothetical protein